jgi:hypothetical protein
MKLDEVHAIVHDLVAIGGTQATTLELEDDEETFRHEDAIDSYPASSEVILEEHAFDERAGRKRQRCAEEVDRCAPLGVLIGVDQPPIASRASCRELTILLSLSSVNSDRLPRYQELIAFECLVP